MSETWTCDVHGRVLPTTPPEGYCPDCLAEMASAPDPETMTGEALAAELDRWCGQLSVPFDLIHARIEALVGRPVWTHEFALGIDRLMHEARERTGRQPSFSDVMASAHVAKRGGRR